MGKAIHFYFLACESQVYPIVTDLRGRKRDKFISTEFLLKVSHLIFAMAFWGRETVERSIEAPRLWVQLTWVQVLVQILNSYITFSKLFILCFSFLPSLLFFNFLFIFLLFFLSTYIYWASYCVSAVMNNDKTYVPWKFTY